ncbi:MAG: thioredoxin [Clostridia bacterium]|nr:thioredoxin [Clostridia bacterium]
MSVIKITSDNFDEVILSAAKPVLLDFWASWCGPCKMLSPIVEEISEENEDIIVGSVNVDEEADLAMQFGIRSIPTLIVFKDGQVANQGIGFMPKQSVLSLIK